MANCENPENFDKNVFQMLIDEENENLKPVSSNFLHPGFSNVTLKCVMLSF